MTRWAGTENKGKHSRLFRSFTDDIRDLCFESMAGRSYVRDNCGKRALTCEIKGVQTAVICRSGHWGTTIRR